MAPKNQRDPQQSVLDSIISDAEDQEQLGDGNEDGIEFDDTDPVDDNDEPDAGDDDNDDSDESEGDNSDSDKSEDNKTDKKQGSDNDAKADEPKSFRYAADSKGNLVDAKGNILFAAGPPRAIFERIKKQWIDKTNESNAQVARIKELTDLGRQVIDRYKQSEAKLRELETSGGIQAKHGLTNDEVQEAMQMRAQFKLDPLGAVRNIVTKLSLGGTDLSSLGIANQADPKAIAEHIANMTKPATASVAEESEEQKAEKEARTFLGDFPEAAPHIELLAEGKRQYPQYSLYKIWSEIQKGAARARAAANKKNGATEPVVNGRPSAPRNGARPQQPGGNKKLNVAPVDPSNSWEQISRDLLRDLQQLEA